MHRTIPRLRTLHARGYAVAAASKPPLSGLSSKARTRAEKLSAEWQGTSATGENTKNFIGGEFVESKASDWIDVVDPVCVVLPRATRNIYTHPRAGITNTAYPCARDDECRV